MKKQLMFLVITVALLLLCQPIIAAEEEVEGTLWEHCSWYPDYTDKEYCCEAAIYEVRYQCEAANDPYGICTDATANYCSSYVYGLIGRSPLIPSDCMNSPWICWAFYLEPVYNECMTGYPGASYFDFCMYQMVSSVTDLCNGEVNWAYISCMAQ